MVPFAVTTDQFAWGVCEGPASTVPPAKMVSLAGLAELSVLGDCEEE
jgi:hypothetical protein